SRMAITISWRDTVAVAGEISSRTARATIQLPAQRNRVAMRTRGAAKRISCMLIWIHARSLRRRPLARSPAAGRRGARARLPARGPGLDRAVAGLSAARREGDRLPRDRLRPLRLRAVGGAAGVPGGDGFHAPRGFEVVTCFVI